MSLRTHYFIGILFFVLSSAVGQTKIDTTKFYDHAYTGSVKEITNKEVCAIVVFISGPDNSWEVKKKNKLLRKDQKAFKKLKKEIGKFGIDFKLHIEAFNLDQDFKADSIVDYTKPVTDDSRVNRYNHVNAEKIWSHYQNSEIPFFINKKYKSYEGGYLLIMHHQGMGRTFAAPDYTHGKRGAGDLPEYCTVFEYTRNRTKNKKFTTVHETLHLFGAWDLYDSSLYGLDNYSALMQQYLPKSIMRNSKNISIDPITAWRIGINEKPEDWFLNIVPQIYHKEFYKEASK